MDINFLQSLDFLIQKVNKNYPTKSWNIVFKLNDELLTANFINDTSNGNVVFSSIESDGDSEKISLMTESLHHELRSKNDFNGEIPLQKLIRYFDSKGSFDIYRLLKSYIEKFQINASALDSFAFNVKNLKTGETFPFLEFDESSKIQFVTLVTDEDLQTLTHASK